MHCVPQSGFPTKINGIVLRYTVHVFDGFCLMELLLVFVSYEERACQRAMACNDGAQTAGRLKDVCKGSNAVLISDMPRGKHM